MLEALLLSYYYQFPQLIIFYFRISAIRCFWNLTPRKSLSTTASYWSEEQIIDRGWGVIDLPVDNLKDYALFDKCKVNSSWINCQVKLSSAHSLSVTSSASLFWTSDLFKGGSQSPPQRSFYEKVKTVIKSR